MGRQVEVQVLQPTYSMSGNFFITLFHTSFAPFSSCRFPLAAISWRFLPHSRPIMTLRVFADFAFD